MQMVPLEDETHALRGPDVNRRILRAAIAVTAAGAVVKLVATGKEMFLADIYGRSDAMDAFLAAVLIPSLLINLISESMNQALVPTLVRVREQEGHNSSQQLLSSAMLCTCALLAAVSLLMAGTAHLFFPLIASHFPPAKLALTIRMFYGLLPVVVLTGIATNCIAVLNTFERFALPALTPVLIPITIIVGTLVFSKDLGIWALVFGTLAGSLLQALAVIALMDRRGYRFRLRWHGMNAATREVAEQYGPVLLSGVVSSGGLLIDQSMAAMLAAGSVAALAYGNRFVSVATALGAGAISTAVTPYFSVAIAHRDWPACRRMIATWVRVTALVSIPVAAILIFAPSAIVRIAFQRGAFAQQDTAVVARVMAMYAIQIPFFVVSRVFYRFIIAMRRTRIALYCGGINLVLDIVLNLVLMRWLGAAGIALATSLWTISTFFFLWYWTRRLLLSQAANDQ
jgi:putative peptidoglycan lipid II flippase